MRKAPGRHGPHGVDFSAADHYFRSMTARLAALLCFLLVLVSCDGGLAPPPAAQPGFGGTVYFVRSSWPPADSIFGLWVFTSQEYLADSTAIFTGLFSNPPTIYLYPGLTGSLSLVAIDSIAYSLNPVPGTYAYTGVIQQTEPVLGAGALRIVGLLSKPGPGFVPDTIRVFGGEYTSGIDMIVDFYNVPPQPF